MTTVFIGTGGLVLVAQYDYSIHYWYQGTGTGDSVESIIQGVWINNPPFNVQEISRKYQMMKSVFGTSHQKLVFLYNPTICETTKLTT